MANRDGPLVSGKLPLDQLRLLLARLPRPDARVIVGPQVGEDAAVIEAGSGRCLVISTDPITFATDRIGRYAVHVNANDVAVLGARPLWFFVVLLLPEGGSPEAAATIMADVANACRELGVSVCGGHTEATSGIDRPIVVGQMIGEVDRARLVRKDRLRIGDRVLLARGVAIEGTAILAREQPARLDGVVDPELVRRAQRLADDPGISVVEAALAVAEACRDVHAMHDPTEGGVATALCELVAPSGFGLRVAREQIFIYPETAAICEALALDPLKLIASGALLVAVPPSAERDALASLRGRGIAASSIGEVRPAAEGLTMVAAGRVTPLTPADRDEITKVS